MEPLISGRLRNYLFSNILLDLQRSEKTGILELKNGPICKKIYIKNGDMIFAMSNQEEDHLGEILLKAKKIGIDQFYQSIDGAKKTGKLQGTILVELGYLKPKDLIWAVTHQVEEIIMSLFRWEDSEFEFIEGPLPSEEVITLKLSTANIIYRGIKRINNFTFIKKVCPPMDAILYYSADPIDLFQDIKLDERDRDIFSLIDGKRKMQDILSASPLDNFQTMKILYALVSTRIIEIKEKAQTIEDRIGEEILKEPDGDLDSAFVEKVNKLYNRLSSPDYHALLGITKWSSPDEIKRSYFKKAKEFHPDRHFNITSETLKNKLNAIFSHLTKAYKTLSNPKARSDYEQSSSFNAATSKESPSEMARSKFKEGKKALGRKLYAEAAELFGQAVYLDSSVADYHFSFGMALMKEKKLREAEEAVNKAIKLNPSNANYTAELGNIYLELGFNARAKATFEKALKLDPSNERVAEGLKNIPNHS